jgi:PAS domain S-box-containing protein
MAVNPDPSPTRPSQATQDERERDLLFNHSRDLLAVAAFDGYLRQVNPAWTRVLGWSREELLSRPVADLMHPDDRERTIRSRQELIEKGTPVNGLENRYLCKDGSYRWLSWQSSVEPGGQTVYAVARDITDRRQNEQERLVHHKLQSTGALAGGIAHDFNNLLAGILLNLEMVGLTGSLNQAQSRHLLQARDTIETARELTRQIITFAHGTSSTRHVVALKTPLRQALEHALAGSFIVGETDFAPALWPALVDEPQLVQVIRNLVQNAREAMPSGGVVKLRAENVTLATPPGPGTKPGDYVRITISDEGSGIAPDTLPLIFDPYFSTKQRGPQKGMGLGLSLCHSILQNHGGAITVDSKPGQGTTVRCFFPAATGRENAASGTSHLPSPERLAATAVADGAPRRVLVLEDEPGLQKIIALALERLGYAAQIAAEGTAAVVLHEEAMRRGAPFDVALLDLTVHGGMGGPEVIGLLRRSAPDLRAILMSGQLREQVFQDYARQGFDAALAKPFSIERLGEVLAEVLAARG